MNHDQSAQPRQQTLTDALRCLYDAPRHRQLRPDCQGDAVVAYGPITLCRNCDLRRSTVGKGTAPRAVPGVELRRLVDAAQTAADAELTQAAHAARNAGASWGPDRRRCWPNPPGSTTTLERTPKPLLA